MQLTPDVRPQQRQSTVLAAQVIQSIKLLQYGQDELQAFLAEQAAGNPLIEIARFGAAEAPDHAVNTTEARRPPAGPAPVAAPMQAGVGAGPRRAGRRGAGPRMPHAGDMRDVEDLVSADVSFIDHLRSQVALSFSRSADRAVAAEIVASLDEDGYLRRDVGDIADTLGTDTRRVEAVLRKVQTFDPAGVAARSLAECLRLQLEDRGQLSPAMETLLDHLPLLAGFRLKELARICGVEVEAVVAMASDIRDLDPRPGRRFDHAPTPPALPDVLVDVRPDGTCTVELNAELLPRVLVDRRYYAQVTSGRLGQQERVFVTDCMRNANWLVRNMEQRAQTILRVATAITARQRAFLRWGIEHLRPLSLKDIARELGIHESTVCRAAANKYMMTNRGMFELGFFFTNAITATDGQESFSAESIRHRIRQLIREESAADVLSDDHIVGVLRAEGVDIARRTVAKYRDGMNIPSSARRRRQKQAAGAMATAEHVAG